MYNHKEIEKKWQNYWETNKTFKVENDFSNSKRIHRYISGELQTTDIETLMKDNLYIAWQSTAMNEFIEWSRNFNSDKSKVNKIKFIGFDSQCGSCAMKEVLSFINNQQPELKTKLSNEGLKLRSKIFRNKDYNLKKLHKDDQDLTEHALERINELFEKEVSLDKDIQMDLLSLNHAWDYENANPLNFLNVSDRNMATIIKEIIKNKTKPVLMWLTIDTLISPNHYFINQSDITCMKISNQNILL
jgi:valyl-tRNA synthetase